MPATPFDWIDDEARRRADAGLVRRLRPRNAEAEPLDLASNDYLGLTRHPEVTAAAADAARRWGGGATGSRLVTGSTALHAELERELAAFCGFEAALVLSSGYAANLAALTALTGRGALIASDAGNHASIVDGCRLSRAETGVVPHADPEAFRKSCAGTTGGSWPSPTRCSPWTATPHRWAHWPPSAGRRTPRSSWTTRTGSVCWATADAARSPRPASRATRTWSPRSPSPSRWAARAARSSDRPGSSSTWSTPPVRSSSTPDSPPRPPARPWAHCGCCAANRGARSGRVRSPPRCTRG